MSPVEIRGAARARRTRPVTLIWIASLTIVVVIAAALLFVGDDGDGVSSEREEIVAIIRSRADLEVIAVDEDARIVSVRTVPGGEIRVLSFDDVRAGRSPSDGPVRSAQSPPSAPRIVESPGRIPAGEVLIRGGDEGEPTPAWVPIYDGAAMPRSPLSSASAEAVSGSLFLTTDDPAVSILDFYQSRLAQDGFTVRRHDLRSRAQGTQGSLTAEDARRGRKVTIRVVRRGAQSQIVLSYLLEKR